MPYAQHELLYPALGKGPELRALLEERVKVQQANGRRVTLGVRLFGGPEGNAYTLNFAHQDLAAYEANRRTPAAPDPTYGAKLATLLSRPVAITLEDVLLPYPATGAPRAPYFTWRVERYPALGKNAELRALLEERVKMNNTRGQRNRLLGSVFGSDSPILTSVLQFQSLAAFDSYRTSLQSETGFAAWTAKVTATLARPNHANLTELLITNPS